MLYKKRVFSMLKKFLIMIGLMAYGTEGFAELERLSFLDSLDLCCKGQTKAFGQGKLKRCGSLDSLIFCQTEDCKGQTKAFGQGKLKRWRCLDSLIF
ncbi:MAG: hypothetical protein ACRC12_03805, partial [Holosporales bacterium]